MTRVYLLTADAMRTTGIEIFVNVTPAAPPGQMITVLCVPPSDPAADN